MPPRTCVRPFTGPQHASVRRAIHVARRTRARAFSTIDRPAHAIDLRARAWDVCVLFTRGPTTACAPQGTLHEDTRFAVGRPLVPWLLCSSRGSSKGNPVPT